MNKMTIEKAIFLAIEAYPYYARGFAAMSTVEYKENTFGIDKYWRLYWSEEALKTFQYDIAAVICHELEHLLRDHANRCQGRDQKIWNIACDAEINDDLEGIPKCCIFPKTIGQKDHLLAEHYYWNNKTQKTKIKFNQIEGSGVTGVSQPWEKEISKEEASEVIFSKEDAEILKDAIASDIRSNKHGEAPSNVKMWAEARAKGKLPVFSWKKAISNILCELTKGMEDWNYSNLSRRQEAKDRILLPATTAYKPSIVVIIDTSGSMANEADWIAGILKDLTRWNCQITLIDCDAQVHSIRKFSNWRKGVLDAVGGGGTDMTVGIKAAQDQKKNLILLLTDGETPWPNYWPKNLVALVKSGKKVSIKKSL
jgi:predicted metal-dependent peptidase